MPTDNNPVVSQLVLDVEALKRNKQNTVTAGGNSMILTRGAVDGELSTLYRTDAINDCRPDITKIPSETAVVAYVETQSQDILKQAKKIAVAAAAPVEKLVQEEKLRATNAETELRTMINCIDLDPLEELIQDETARALAVESGLLQKITDETSRATTAEGNLSKSLHEEISRASEVEGNLSHAINDEVNRAKTAERSLSDRTTALADKIKEVKNELSNEVTRATGAENSLDSKIDTAVETLRHSDDQILSALNNESTRASAAEATLLTKINSEIERAISEEKRIERVVSGIDYDEKINALKEHVLVHEGIVDQRVTDEVARATSAEDALRIMITDETTRSTRVDDAHEKSLRDEITRATAAEAELKESLRAEITRSLSRDDILEGKISNEVERATKVEHELYVELGNINDKINDHDSDYDKKLDEIKDLVAGATGQDKDLEDKINNEITRATAAEATLAANLTAETNRAETMEDHISKNLIDEIARAKTEENLIRDDLDAETRRAKAAETHLDEEIAHERTRAIAEEEKINLKFDEYEKDKVDKTIAGEDGLIVKSIGLTLEDSPLGDKNAKQIIFNKKMLNLFNGEITESQVQHDLAVISGSHAVKEDLASEVQRAQTEEKAIRDKMTETIEFMEKNAISQDTFKNNGYKVMSSQEFHNEPDAYGSSFWLRNISKTVDDTHADITQEMHVVSDTMDIKLSRLDQNDCRLDVNFRVSTEDSIKNMMKSIFGVEV